MDNVVEKKTRCCSEEANLARQEEILETATALFAEQGFSDAVTQALAERLGVGKGTIYRHFPSKRALFLAATDRVMRKLQERVTRNVSGIEDGLERIERAVATFLQFFADHPSFVELLIQERAHFKDRKRPTYFEHRDVNIRRWLQLYRELMVAGRIREMPVERIATVVSNVLYGIMVTNFFNGQPAPADVQAREILDIIFMGILTEPERRRRQGETDGPASGAAVSGGELLGGANGDEATRVDGPVGADGGGDGGGVPAGAVVAGAADPDRRV
jgi:AcrR family transcriptional regulator